MGRRTRHLGSGDDRASDFAKRGLLADLFDGLLDELLVEGEVLEVDALIVAVDAFVFVEGAGDADAVGVDAAGAEEGGVGGTGGHHGDGDGCGDEFLLCGFESAEHSGVERAGGCGGHVVDGVEGFDGDGGIVNDGSHVGVEGGHGFVGEGADVDDGFGVGGDDVGFKAAFEDGGDEGGMHHGVELGHGGVELRLRRGGVEIAEESGLIWG